MGVDEQFFRAEVDQMGAPKSDERLLGEGHEWLRQFVGQRAQSRSQSGAEDECLFDFSHRVRTRAWRRKQSGVAAFRSGKTSAFLLSNSSSDRKSTRLNSNHTDISPM